jgi:uncharacterized protein
MLPSFSEKRDQLLQLISSYDRCIVAFSGGVDSAVVAKAAALALADRALAVTAVSPSLAAGELDEARHLAQLIGIRHEVIDTSELDNPDYVRNDPRRCYHCKSELYAHLDVLADRFQAGVVVNGANADDQYDYRPGLQAASEHRVRSPLAECGMTKQDVRELAADWLLPVWNKPASPCLSSRVAYGEPVTAERLAMIDQAERFLREQGLSTVRVRCHRGDLARLEVPSEAISRLASDPLRQTLVTRLRELGFTFVTLDLEGFRSGSLNTLLPLEAVERSAAEYR